MSTSNAPNALREFAEALRNELTPETPLENVYVEEIIHAAWRLRYCDPDDDRSRAAAHRILRDATAELRRLQTERQIREELDPEMTPIGLADYRALLAAYNAQKRHELAARKLNGQDTMLKIVDASLPPVPRPASPAAESKPIARGALCPCGSGEKYKRCCGINAPPLLHKAA